MVVRAPASRRSPEQTEERLLVEAAQKDPARFAELYEINFERVYAFGNQWYIATHVRDAPILPKEESSKTHDGIRPAWHLGNWASALVAARIDPRMDLESKVGSRAYAVAVWQKARGQFARLPATARVMLGLFLLAALLMAVHTAYWGKDAGLRLRVQHSLRSGQISVWVDGELAYSGNLVGNSKRKFGLIPAVQGSLSETLPVATGTHQIKIQVVSDGGAREKTISGDFAHNGQRALSVIASRDDLSLNWQALNSQSLNSPQAVGAESSSTGQGWFSRYAGTLMMTVAGSIISALAGFALRELPKHLVSRQGAVPKSLNNQAS